MALRPRDTQIPRYIFLTNSQLCQHSLPYFLHEGRINLFDSDSSESANGHIITSQPRSSIRFSKQVNHISNVGRIQFHLCQTTVNHYQASSSHLYDEHVVRIAGIMWTRCDFSLFDILYWTPSDFFFFVTGVSLLLDRIKQSTVYVSPSNEFSLPLILRKYLYSLNREQSSRMISWSVAEAYIEGLGIKWWESRVSGFPYFWLGCSVPKDFSFLHGSHQWESMKWWQMIEISFSRRLNEMGDEI